MGAHGLGSGFPSLMGALVPWSGLSALVLSPLLIPSPYSLPLGLYIPGGTKQSRKVKWGLRSRSFSLPLCPAGCVTRENLSAKLPQAASYCSKGANLLYPETGNQNHVGCLRAQLIPHVCREGTWLGLDSLASCQGADCCILYHLFEKWRGKTQAFTPKCMWEG